MATKTTVKKKICCSCPPDKAEQHIQKFYKSNSPLHQDGLVPMCKECVKNNSTDEMGRIDVKKFNNVLRQIDKPFINDVLQSAINQFKKGFTITDDEDEILKHGDRIISLYFKNIQSLPQYSGMSYEDSLNKSPQPSSMNSQPSATQVIGNELDEVIYSKEWKGNYTKRDLIDLDEYYEGLNRDYKIITSNHRDYARKIAKASLQMDKCFEDMMNGVNGADQKYKNARETFDALCKSAKFSESTRSVNDVGISGFSKVSEIVEAHNWIPKHQPEEKDVIDQMLEHLSTITKSI
jgi:hypothetical protein